MKHYVIAGGREGRERLKLLSKILLPTTSQLLNTVGLRTGMKCLDVGCGGGDVTQLMAVIVGENGSAVGTDSDQTILELAREDAESAQINNVEFREIDALDCQYEEEYDLVYARFLLTHLREPEKCLDAMVKACRPGGLIVIEDIEFSGSFCYPYSAAYERYVELYQEVVSRRGGDPNIGIKLPGLLRQAGLKAIQVNVIQPAHLEGDGKFMASVTMEKIAASVISERLATKEEVEQIINELNEAAANVEIMISMPRIFQTWGKRV